MINKAEATLANIPNNIAKPPITSRSQLTMEHDSRISMIILRAQRFLIPISILTKNINSIIAINW
jgi:hypothetical protein